MRQRFIEPNAYSYLARKLRRRPAKKFFIAAFTGSQEYELHISFDQRGKNFFD
jgi:hypothetical protein